MEAGPFALELKSYLGLDPEDSAILRRFHPLAKPHFARIADEFYEVIRRHAGAYAVIRDEAQARRLHGSLQQWLEELLQGPHDPAYVERHGRIGRVHVKVGLNQHYMVTAMNRVADSLHAIAAGSYPDDPILVARTQTALARVCDFDLAIMLDSYRDDYIARIQRVERMEKEALQTRLTALESFYGEAMEAADVLLMGLDERGHLVVFNPKAVAITGVAREEALGHDAFPLFFPERAEDVRKAMLAATDQGPVTLEEPLTTRSGARRTVRWHVSTRSNDAAKRTFVAIGVDVTDQRALERTAVQNERLAAVGALAAGLAHEIRNPLNGANLHMAILERALRKWQGAPISIPETIGVVTGELQRLSGLVSDFLEVARPKPLNRTAWDANEVARGCVFLMAPAAEARQVALTLEDAPLPYSLMLDGERMKQVLVNLVQNAMEAISKPGGHVVVRVRRTPSHGEFEVEDDGVGLNDPKAPIFDAFYTTKETGTGLGLSIVHRIVTDHGGTIEVSSVPGCTRFTIRIPLAGI